MQFVRHVSTPLSTTTPNSTTFPQPLSLDPTHNSDQTHIAAVQAYHSQLAPYLHSRKGATPLAVVMSMWILAVAIANIAAKDAIKLLTMLMIQEMQLQACDKGQATMVQEQSAHIFSLQHTTSYQSDKHLLPAANCPDQEAFTHLPSRCPDEEAFTQSPLISPDQDDQHRHGEEALPHQGTAPTAQNVWQQLVMTKGRW